MIRFTSKKYFCLFYDSSRIWLLINVRWIKKSIPTTLSDARLLFLFASLKLRSISKNCAKYMWWCSGCIFAGTPTATRTQVSASGGQRSIHWAMGAFRARFYHNSHAYPLRNCASQISCRAANGNACISFWSFLRPVFHVMINSCRARVMPT